MALPVGNLFVDPNIKLVAPELPVDEMKYVWDTKQKVYDQNLADVTKIGMLAKNTKGTANDTEDIQNVVNQYKGIIGQIASKGDYENQTLGVNALAEQFYTDPKIQKFNENYQLQKQEEALINEMTTKGLKPLDFGKSYRQQFKTIQRDEQGNEILQTYTPKVQAMGDWTGRITNLVSGIAGDTYDIPPSVWEDNKETIKAIRQGKVSEISGPKLEKLIDDLLPTYINTTTEGKQHLAAYSELDEYTPYHKDPLGAIKRDMMSIARKQQGKAVDYSYSNVTPVKPQGYGDDEDLEGTGGEALPYEKTKENTMLSDLYKRATTAPEDMPLKGSGKRPLQGAGITEFPSLKDVKKGVQQLFTETPISIPTTIADLEKRLTPEQQKVSKVFFKYSDPNQPEASKIQQFLNYVQNQSQTKIAPTYRSILDASDREAATKYVEDNINSRQVWDIDEGKFTTVNLDENQKKRGKLLGRLTADNPIYDDIKGAIVEEGAATPEAAKLFSRGYVYNIDGKRFIVGEAEPSLKDPKSSVHFNAFKSELTSARRTGLPIQIKKATVVHIPNTESLYEVELPDAGVIQVDASNPAQVRALYNLVNKK